METKTITLQNLCEPLNGYHAAGTRTTDPTTQTITFVLTVTNPKGTDYTVTTRFTNPETPYRWECTCPDYVHGGYLKRRTNPYRACKHILGVLRTLGQAESRWTHAWEPLLRQQPKQPPKTRTVQPASPSEQNDGRPEPDPTMPWYEPLLEPDEEENANREKAS